MKVIPVIILVINARLVDKVIISINANSLQLNLAGRKTPIIVANLDLDLKFVPGYGKEMAHHL